MSVRTFNYGPSLREKMLAAPILGVISTTIAVGLAFRANYAAQSWDETFSGSAEWVFALIALLGLLLAARLVWTARKGDRDRQKSLTTNRQGIDYRATKRRSAAPVEIAYDDIHFAKVVEDEDGSVDFKVGHAGGDLTFHKMWFDNRASFETFVSIVRQRSNQG